MNVPYVSLTLTRRYVTELVRSPHAVTALAPRGTRASTSAPKDAAGMEAPATMPPRIGTTAPMIPQAAQRVV